MSCRRVPALGWGRRLSDLFALVLLAVIAALTALLVTYSPQDPSLNSSGGGAVQNVFGKYGAWLADLIMQTLGFSAYLIPLVLLGWVWRCLRHQSLKPFWLRFAALPAGLFMICVAVYPLPAWESWPLNSGLGGAAGFILNEKLGETLGWGDQPDGAPGGDAGGDADRLCLRLALARGGGAVRLAAGLLEPLGRRASPCSPARDPGRARGACRRDAKGTALEESWDGPSERASRSAQEPARLRIEVPPAMAEQAARVAANEEAGEDKVETLEMPQEELKQEPASAEAPKKRRMPKLLSGRFGRGDRREPSLFRSKSEGRQREEPQLFKGSVEPDEALASAPTPPEDGPDLSAVMPQPAPPTPAPAPPPKPRAKAKPPQPELDLRQQGEYQPPGLDYLKPADPGQGPSLESQDALEKNARLLEGVLEDFGVRGEIVTVRPGPVVTRYELEPAPGTKTSRVIGLADDIARSMSALSVRVAVVPGSSVIGIELPNARRQTVLLSDILANKAYHDAGHRLALVLGKDIGGAPQVVDLARMPHLLVAGTTGSGKSVAINAMIMSLLYRLSPEQCRLIMVDPKMLELSVYDGIPHLLSPVVTDPKKAVVALKWAVREMEDRYRAMSHLGVRNIDGYNARVAEALDKGEVLTRRVQTGFDPDTGEPVIEQQPLDLKSLPYIVVIVDEMADLMLVAGKEIEGAVQRLAQMARAAGIHLIMATQRPSVDVITGTIKANFPTRISFHVTSKIDSRTILGEMGAEQLLGQGDMLYLGSGGRIQRVHGPFVSDQEVEQVVEYLRKQAPSDYVTEVTEEPDELPMEALADDGDGDQLYRQAVELVHQHKKASTSFVQRHLQIGYNRAARLVERMEQEGLVSPANHVGKREVYGGD